VGIASNLSRSPSRSGWTERLTGLSFAETVFLCNSGAERWKPDQGRAQYHAKSAPKKYRLICCNGSFHGPHAGDAGRRRNENTSKARAALAGLRPFAYGNLNEMRKTRWARNRRGHRSSR